MGYQRKMTPSDMPVEERAQELETTRWAREFSWDEILALARYLRRFTAEEGTVIVEEGTTDRSLTILLDGKVDVVRTDRAGRQRVITTLTKPQAFGEVALLDAQPRSATVRAATEVKVLVMTYANFELLCQEEKDVALHFVRKLGSLACNRIRQTSWWLVEAMELLAESEPILEAMADLDVSASSEVRQAAEEALRRLRAKS
jgi:CRP-like cAMP-binding protein